MRFLLATTFLAFLTVSRTNATEVSCETIKSFRDDGIDFRCFMNGNTVIDAEDYTISDAKNLKVEGINFFSSDKIKYLPVHVHEKFPNMIKYPASNCQIKKVSKKNFEKLMKLTYIGLSQNQIETIPSDTFKGLPRLSMITLQENKIKTMKGRPFDDLPALSIVYLAENNCIDQNYLSDTISALSKDVEDKCG